jgi:four helix bundle protein
LQISDFRFDSIIPFDLQSEIVDLQSEINFLSPKHEIATMTREQLEDRLIDFAVRILKICQMLPKTQGGSVLSAQMLRSGTSPALNYGEAQSAESSRDFLHKMQVVLKELRENLICLKIVQRSGLIRQTETTASAMRENNELIAIFVKSIQTAKKRIQGEAKAGK